ncbi:iron complex outermembrane receptor protein [Paucibacter oligotrophus]|uniref:Iron complex outermembrane receptor protein n=1 Tax=Roseateles oligotrophus TaxID=1769250 RepID=A0A840L922_9BURK|nr:TonB-dependent receptor [Roseateles oligotrophus]MBB4844670.1 iron complex outermembrane receptor protein [Roseateles oligotrophus]
MPKLKLKPTTQAALLLLALSQLTVQAQTPPPAQLEQVLVTGSRAKDRSLLNSAVPVDVLSQEDLQRAVAGDGNLAAALQTLLPSFNFPRQSNSGGGDHVRAAQLRGLSPDQVLVLVNGKRRHNSAIVNLESKTGKGTNPVDFNAIPFSAIQRIEVLRDGAGAQYGSDAIAGVINIILDEARSGGEIQGQVGGFHTRFEPTHETIQDGASRELRGKLGFKLGEAGFVRLGAEAAHRDHTNRAGADQLPPWEDQSPANLAFQGKRNYAPGEPESDQLALWLNSAYALGADAQAYAFATWQQRESLGAAYFRYPDSSANVKALYPQGYRPETTGKSRDLQIAAGLRGSLGADKAWDYDLSFNLGRNDFSYGLRNSLNVSLGAASPSQFQLGDFGTQHLGLSADFRRELALGLAKPATLALGLEARRESFRTRAGDAASYSVGPFDGTPGAQAGPGLQAGDAVDLSRQLIGAYADLSADLSQDLFANLALRADRYSDFGSALTAKLSGRYVLAQGLALRGAASSNFRAPSLAQTGFSFTVTDRGEGGSLSQVRTLPVGSAIAQALGAEQLKAENARNASLGLSWQPSKSASLSIDAFDVRVKDRITLSERLSNEALTQLVQTRFNVAGVNGVNFFTNAVDTHTRGIDLVGQWTQQGILGGELRWTLASSYNKTTLSHVRNTGAALKALGIDKPLVGLEESNTLTAAAPRDRHVIGANWHNSQWKLLARATRHGQTTRVFDFGGGYTPSQTYAAVWQLDLEAEVKLTRQFSLSLGGVNVTDRYPSRSVDDISYFGNFPYDVLSPVGFNGAFYYARARYSF